MTTPHKHAALIKAWADGAVIQCRTPGGVWADLAQDRITWGVYAEYRIKPEVTTSLSDEVLYNQYYVPVYYATADNQHFSKVHAALRAVADAAIKQYIKEQTK